MKILTTIVLGLFMLSIGPSFSAVAEDTNQKANTAPSGVPDRSGNVHGMGDGQQMRKNEPMGKNVSGAGGKAMGAGSTGTDDMAAQMQKMKDHSKMMAGMTD